MKKTRELTGLRVRRKRDQANATVVGTSVAFTRGVRHPFKTLVHVDLHDADKWSAAGGTMVGDLSWFHSVFEILKEK